MAADGDQETAVHGHPEVAGPPAPPGPVASQDLGPSPVAAASSGFDERPEAYLGAAFAGGLALALVVRWIRS